MNKSIEDYTETELHTILDEAEKMALATIHYLYHDTQDDHCLNEIETNKLHHAMEIIHYVHEHK